MSLDENDSCILVSYDEVPATVLKLVARVENLKNAVNVFRGWDEEVALSRSSAIKSVCNSIKNLRVWKSHLQTIQAHLASCQDIGNHAKKLDRKCKFIINNIPDRFNLPSNIRGPKPEPTRQPGKVCSETDLVKSSATCGKEQPAKSVPDILFLTLEEFEKIPKYLKGRVTYDKVNAFIEVLNKVISYKYNIFKKKKSTLKKKEADLWNEYYKQELKDTKGLYFCVAKDFQNCNGGALDKSSLNMLTILRHCGRIREIRTGGILRYVAVF